MRVLTTAAPDAGPGPTRLYQVLQDAHRSPRWLAGLLRLPDSIVLGWCWGLDLPPDAIRARVERLLEDRELPANGLWGPLNVSDLRPFHLQLVRDPDDASTTAPFNPGQEGKKMDLIPREYLTQPELERFQIPAGPDGVRPDPFDSSEDPEDIFRSPTTSALEGILWEAVKKRQILIVLGEPGAGKSTLLRRAYGSARREKQVRFLSPGTLDRKKVSHKTLAVAILRDLVGKDTSNMAQEVRDNLLRDTLARQRGVYPVVFVDEAHHLKNEALLAIKHIWDSHTLFKQIAVVLVGHPILGQRLAQDPEVREFTFRTRLVELPAYDVATTAAYLDWRWARVHAGKATEAFTPAALEILARRGRTPLMINNLAIRGMRLAAPTGRKVEAEHMGRV